MNEYQLRLADFFKHLGQSIEEAHDHNTGLKIVIHPEDVHELYVAFKSENLIFH